ncbi:sulfurtransferase TusA family protein [Aneurinibacillus sp. Ricciae_BoGa-3]|uniref:sulfurtransferase TusA family protein n=1 Tax=Aneurinibacillus sp. Ricciae_BoGa-3 TaxID=3022697 RepID=UPI00234079A8|nr:sulfurtransferase TusA family protein [Aneurinibacillus sp. Ricciae_BoGa-3]WCK53901.1 sulfurtransferase TusA family protein [Aneurinibacillus sp. Ricciae_BoGa-3]
MEISVDKIVDAKGLACPMPIVKTKKAMDSIDAGQVLELQATDRGSLADIQGWAKNTGHQYLGTREEGDVLKHYIRKARAEETKEETKYPHTIQNEELEKKLLEHQDITVLDVREPAEYAFGRIPGAKSLPLGELESRIHELNPEEKIHVICRTGTRSDLACQLLTERGFLHVTNTLPGMSQWKGNLEKD